MHNEYNNKKYQFLYQSKKFSNESTAQNRKTIIAQKYLGNLHGQWTCYYSFKLEINFFLYKPILA